MGGKSDGPAPPEVADPSGDMAAMMQMMGAMSAMPSFAPPGVPDVPEPPALERTAEVDWAERHEELSTRAKADYKNDQAGRKGRSDTIHSSPLLDEEESSKPAASIAGGG